MSDKSNTPNDDEFDNLIKELKGSDKKLKKNALEILEEKALNNENITKAVITLEKLILQKDEYIWKKSGDILAYYFQIIFNLFF
ncbi:unnamed protein product [marine sediment metagenome]|uniref:Uncharacterized protein n=1 Tax=marine sediment metagenome TaxID=412755 RepID=X1H7X5_9ZZZZ